MEQGWQKTLSFLQDYVNPVTYNQWFIPLTPFYLDEEEGIFEFTIPETFNEEIAKNAYDRYRSVIESCLHDAFGRQLKMKYMYPEEAEKRGTRTQVLIEPEFKKELSLNPKYVFDSFVVGVNNRIAHAASMAVAEQPSRVYNPLFLYGGVGLGKTHLMHAIAHHSIQKNPNLKVLYVTAETFTNETIKAIRDGKMTEFRQKYRENVDLLLVDDVQFLENKVATQEEFFFTFNALHEGGKQIILSSDRLPKYISTLEERLRSRFEWGLIADIQPPDYENRVAILLKKAEQEKIALDDDVMDVINLVAEKVKNNIRELEGAFVKVVAHASITDQKISRDLAKSVLKDIFFSENKDITPELIKKQVCKYYGIKPADMDSSKRTRSIAFPRQIAMYLCREMTDLSLPKIGESFSNKDHTTILHGCKKIEEILATDENLSNVIDYLKDVIRDM